MQVNDESLFAIGIAYHHLAKKHYSFILCSDVFANNVGLNELDNGLISIKQHFN